MDFAAYAKQLVHTGFQKIIDGAPFGTRWALAAVLPEAEKVIVAKIDAVAADVAALLAKYGIKNVTITC